MAITDGEIAFLLDTRSFFSDVSIWPQRPRYVDPQGWLSNFAPEDVAIAAHLLDSFLLISTEQTEKMMSSAFHSLSSTLGDIFTQDAATYQSSWDAFRGTTKITFPAKRNDPAGSGHLFVRAARDLVVAPKDQIYDPSNLAIEIWKRGSPAVVVFVDDFAGTGDQFVGAWIRGHERGDGKRISFNDLSAAGLIEHAYFIPSICTARAKSRIADLAPTVDVRPAHLLPPRYSAKDDATTLVPDNLRGELPKFLERYADAAGYNPKYPYGYGDSGLAVSFEHSTPDNTMPIFNGGQAMPAAWKPLRSK